MSYCNNHNNKDNTAKNLSNKWSELSYVYENRVPQGEEIVSYSWPLCFLKKNEDNLFTNSKGDVIPLDIKEPDLLLNLKAEFDHVVKIQKSLTPTQLKIAKYWGDGPPTKQFMPIADILIDTYGVYACRASRILHVLNGALNDSFIICWYLKYKWDILRPCQYDQTFVPAICTPKHPTYPAGHSTSAGCMAEILSYFFPAEREKLFILAKECSDSRVYGGVHFKPDCDEGIKLGVSIAKAIIDDLVNDSNKHGVKVDLQYTEFKDADIFPKNYTQYIPFDRKPSCPASSIKSRTKL